MIYLFIYLLCHIYPGVPHQCATLFSLGLLQVIDTVIVGLISNNDESEYNEQISEVVLWCKAHNPLLNAAKTKELIFDFRHCNISHVPLSIDNSIVEICDNFKYLGITFDCKLNGQITVH